MHVSSSPLKRVVIGATSLALGFAALGTVQAVASQPAGKAPVIDTYPDWDGVQYIYPFGCPDTTTYGSTVTIPKKKHHITKFTFPWEDIGSGSMVVRAHVYAWDTVNNRATGSALGSSSPVTINSGSSGFVDRTFKLKTSKLKPGGIYVIFASIAEDYEQCTGSYEVEWGSPFNDTAYADGTMVYQNNAGDESQWTTQPWNNIGLDLTMKVYMKK